jgi:CO/xanthine dehydrogenase Mo-binding subunit
MEMTPNVDKTLSRRTFVKGGGSLVVAFSLAGAAAGETLGKSTGAGKAAAANVWPRPPVNQVDSFLEIRADNTIIAKFGKGTAAQGTSTGVVMMYADELDVPLSSISMIVGDTYLTPDQVGASGSNGTSTEWVEVRRAAATARQHLLNLASARLGVPVANLTVKDGVVSGTGTSQTVTYGQLIGGQKFNLTISPTAPQKTPAQFKVMGTPQQTIEIPRIVTGTHEYAADVRLPGMLYATHVRPPVAGATLVSVNGPHNLPGVVKVVAKGNYLAVVAKSQWQSIQAAHALDATWKPPAAPPLPNGYDAFYDYLADGPKASQSVTRVGDAPGAIAKAAKVVEATYKIDFQGHSTVGPSAALADYRDGSCVVWMGGQKPYGQQGAITDMLKTLVNPNITMDNVRVIYVHGASSFGRGESDDVSMEAAYLSALVGAPVRVQWTRAEASSWDTKGAPGLVKVQAGLDAANKVVGFNWWSSSVKKQPFAAITLGDTLMGQLMGYKPSRYDDSFLSYSGYGYPNVLMTATNVPWTQAEGTGLWSAHLRSPTGTQLSFAAESFEDELAAAAGLDPIAYRLTYLSNPRQVRVVKELAKASGWASRPGPNPASSSNATVVSGRGIALKANGTAAIVAVVKVNRKTGHVQVTRITSANDHGFVVNPAALTTTVKAAVMYGTSRALFERTTFTSSKVTTVDWESYRILGIEDAPKIKVVLVGSDGIAPDGTFTTPQGAAEPAQDATPAAIANAIFDATGVRVRRMPMTPDVVLEALKAGGKAL